MNVERWRQNGLYFSTKQLNPERYPEYWLTWCSFQELTADDPMYERPEQQVWSQYSKSRSEAIELLLKEIGS